MSSVRKRALTFLCLQCQGATSPTGQLHISRQMVMKSAAGRIHHRPKPGQRDRCSGSASPPRQSARGSAQNTQNASYTRSTGPARTSDPTGTPRTPRQPRSSEFSGIPRTSGSSRTSDPCRTTTRSAQSSRSKAKRSQPHRSARMARVEYAVANSGGDENKSQEVVTQLLQEALETETEDSNRQTFISSQGKEYDRFGFLKFGHDEDDVLLSRANILQRQSVEIGYMIRDVDEETTTRTKWEKYMLGFSASKQLVRSTELKTLIRLGVPHDCRERIWKGCISLCVNQSRIKLGDKYFKELEERAMNSRSSPAMKQIELDLLRTLPDNRFFEKMESPGIPKLRKVLLCYSVHNPLIGYCQGLNRIAAIALLFLTEEDAFWCLVSIIEHLMPADYYTNTLAAAQADQRVLKDLVQDKCPKLHAHLETHDVDLSLFTFNWFLTIFVDGILPELFVKVWDVFLYEGSKVLFRFALAFLKYVEEDILEQSSTLAINRYMRTLGENITDVRKIATIAFSELNPFPMRSISSKRHHHLQHVKFELEELEAIRKDFKSAHESEEFDHQEEEREGYISDDDLDDPRD